jgi:hypothetical protein
MGLDNRVWRVMILVLILTSGLLGYKLLDRPKCVPVDFKIKTLSENDSTYYTDEILSFAVSNPAENITWDFNDNTGTQEGTFVTHRFKTEGKYYIKLTVNSGCESIHLITVKKAIPDDIGNGKEFIGGHDNTFVGVSETFTSLQHADSYEWNILDHPEYGSHTGLTTNYKFLQPGDYTIELVLNKSRLKKYRKTITVGGSSKPSGPKTLIPTTLKPLPSILISDATFKEYIEKVVAGTYTVKDFDNYLCTDAATPTVLNGDTKNQETFGQVCEELAGKKKRKNMFKKRLIRISSVRLQRDADNCVTLIEINTH